MRCVVTGGCGFVGSHLVEKLVKLNHKVTIIDNLSTGRDFNIPIESDFRLIDLTTSGFTKSLPQTITHIFHLAAQSSAEISFEDPLYDIQINTISTL